VFDEVQAQGLGGQAGDAAAEAVGFDHRRTSVGVGGHQAVAAVLEAEIQLKGRRIGQHAVAPAPPPFISEGHSTQRSRKLSSTGSA
jgi:hypothetical protein